MNGNYRMLQTMGNIYSETNLATRNVDDLEILLRDAQEGNNS